MVSLIDRLSNEADLCRNEGADDIADLLQLAVAAMEFREIAHDTELSKLRSEVECLRDENSNLKKWRQGAKPGPETNGQFG